MLGGGGGVPTGAGAKWNQIAGSLAVVRWSLQFSRNRNTNGFGAGSCNWYAWTKLLPIPISYRFALSVGAGPGIGSSVAQRCYGLFLGLSISNFYFNVDSQLKAST